MPQIPTLSPPLEAPSSTGMPLRAQQAPSVPQPQGSQAAAGLVGQSVGQLGQDVQRTAGLLQYTAEVQAQSRRAQDVLDAKTRLYDYILGLDQAYDTLSQGDYRTLPEEVLTQGRALMGQFTEGLSPRAGALFREDAMQRLAVVQQKALGERTQRRDADTVYLMSRAKDQAALDVSNATNDAEYAEAMGRFQQLQHDMVKAGLVRGDAAAKEVMDVQQQSQDITTTRWIAADPQRALQHFEALLDNQPSPIEGGPVVPTGKVKAYHDMAEKEYKEALSVAESQRVVAEREIDQAQDLNERELTNQAMSAPNVSALMALQRTVGGLAMDQTGTGVSGAGQRRLFSLIQARIDDLKQLARAGAGDSNDAVLTRLGISTFAQRGHRPLAETQALMDQTVKAVQSGQLKWKDAKLLLVAQQEEMREDSPLRLPEVGRQRDELFKEMQATGPFDKFDETAESRRMGALREFDERIQAIAGSEGALSAQRQAEPIRRELSDTFAASTVRKTYERLNVPPRELPPGLVDETGLPDSGMAIEQRYGAGKQEILRRLDTQQYTKEQAARHLATLDERKKWWQYLLEQQPPKQPAAQKTQSWLDWAQQLVKPKPPAAPQAPADSGGIPRNR